MIRLVCGVREPETNPAPILVQYIREHDLWRFELPDSNKVRAYIRSYPPMFAVKACLHISTTRASDARWMTVPSLCAITKSIWSVVFRKSQFSYVIGYDRM